MKKIYLIIILILFPFISVGQEFEDEKYGFRAAKHQSFVGAGYFDAVQNTIMAGQSSTTAMDGSTEEEQFTK